MQGSQGPEPFGDYVLLERIAVGGMAELFRAELMNGEQFETPICIKRILPHYSDDENFVNMFIDEATIAAQLAHPNIVKIYEFNAYDGSYFIAMELVDGKDLKQTLELAYRKQTRLTAPMIAYIARDVVSALHYAHARRVDGKPLGIIHRDVSPHNVLLGFNGDVKLTDFGIAKAASRLTHTRAGTVKGKCAYMSPEQARGKTLDGRSDLFSVGILIHEMLTGRRLFTGESDFEILSKVIRDPIPRPSDIVPDVDPELEQICIRTLERDRDRRWRDGMEMEEALTNWMRARGVDHTNTGLDRFVQSVFGRANHPLPTPGVSSTPHSKQDEMALAAAMPTAMLTPGMLPEESPSNNSAPPSDDPNMQRTMALDMPPSPSGPPPTAQNSDDRTAIFDLDSAPSDLGLGGYDDPSPPPPQPATDYGSDSQKHERTAVFNALDHDLGPPPGHPARPPSPPPTNWFNIALIGAIFGVLGLTLCVIAVGAIMLEPDLLGESKPAVASSKGKKNKGKKSKGRKSKTRKTSPKKGSEDSAQAKTKDDSKKSDSAAAQAKKTPTPNDKTTSKDDGKADTPKDDDKATARIDEKDTPKDKPAEDKPKAQDKGTSDDRDTTSNTTADTSQDHASKNDVTKGDTPKGDTPKGDTNKTDTNKDDTPQANGKSGDQGDTATATKATDSTPSSNDSNTTDKPQENGLATITIKATPWADVFLDGRRLGRTPISRVEVAPGKHVVLFKNEDLRKKKRKDIEVASGENAQVSHEFK